MLKFCWLSIFCTFYVSVDPHLCKHCKTQLRACNDGKADSEIMTIGGRHYGLVHYNYYHVFYGL